MKPLLYVYRVLLTGFHLLRTGTVEAHLVRLNEAFRLPCVPELVARKVEGSERSALAGADVAFHEAEYRRLTPSGTERVYPFQMGLVAGEGGLPRPGKVLLEQVRTLAKRRLGERLGSLTSERMREVDTALKRNLGLGL